MKLSFYRNEDLCPECGHLLPQTAGNCQFCGWSFNDVKSYTSEFDSMDEYLYLDTENIPIVDRDIEHLIDIA